MGTDLLNFYSTSEPPDSSSVEFGYHDTNKNDAELRNVVELVANDHGATVANVSDNGKIDLGPLRRSKRRRRRAKADLGLPSDAELSKLARVYLEKQRQHWPQLIEAGVLPEPTDDVIAVMVEDFKHRHRTGVVTPPDFSIILRHCKGAGGLYTRFSTKGSDPKSILEQTGNGLDKAKEEGRFVPWCYVFCDYSRSGYFTARQGYLNYKKLLRDKNHPINTTYIDDFSRASREELEWWQLAATSFQTNTRLIGASDGFSLDDQDWDTKVRFYGLLSAMFKKDLQRKVKRGMRATFLAGGVIGKLILGHTKKVRLDAAGNPMLKTNGTPKYERCIDDSTKDSKEHLYRLFLEKKKTPYRIAQIFNRLKIDDWEGWTDDSVTYELANPANIGVFIWNQFSTEYNWDTKKWERRRNPASEMAVYVNRKLGLVDIDWWKQARRKLGQTRRNSPLTGKPLSRNEKSASTLFSGVLYCDYCDPLQELLLVRSAGKYQQLGCPNGARHKHDCKLRCSKSVRIIETSLLEYIQDGIFTEERITQLVVAANAYIEVEARRPRIDTRAMKSKVKRLRANIATYFDRMDETDDANLRDAYDKRITTKQKELTAVLANLHDAERVNVVPPPPLDLDRVKVYVSDLRALLNQETAASAELIRTLTGMIKIRQEKHANGKPGAKWIASFSPNLLGLLRQIGRDKNYPDSLTLEFLSRGIWIKPIAVECVIDDSPVYVRIRDDVVALRAARDSRNTIAVKLGVNIETVDNALKVDNGQPPRKYPKKNRNQAQARSKRVNYRDIADDVAYRHDHRGHTFKQIAKDLGHCESMIRRAYDHARPDLIEEAIESGNPPRRARNSRLGEAKKQLIAELILKGDRTCDIVKKVGCSRQTVARMRKKMSDGV
ncbi:MAG: recombinase family protein [Pirellulales bacterium]|nr:recombinase family protein [Pirellulales bacterium]